MADEFLPVKIGFLGAALDGEGGAFDLIHRMAFDEAYEQGVLTRRVEVLIHPEDGLPRGSARNATEGFRWLVDQGCIGVAGAYSSDNAITVGRVADELEVPLISWCGTERYSGEYCFQLGNGDCGGDAALMVHWLKRNGHERVAVLNELSPNGEEYFRFFRQECRRWGVSIAALAAPARISRAAPTTTRCSRATGSFTAGCRTETWSSRTTTSPVRYEPAPCGATCRRSYMNDAPSVRPQSGFGPTKRL
jgi:hypothetical protein